MGDYGGELAAGPVPQSRDWGDHWDADDARTAIDTYDAYFGTYEVDPERDLVTHVVVGELRPPGVGARYGRRFELRGDELWLTPEDPSEGWRVVWRRVR